MNHFGKLFLGVLVIFSFGFGIWMAIVDSRESLYENQKHQFSYLFASQELYESAVETARSLKRTGAHSGIVAHHLLVADKIAQTFASLGTGREKTIVILSPNHFSLGHSALQTTDGTWKTAFGDVEVDVKTLEKVMELVPDLSYEPETFEMEHGVSAIVPFVKTFFPHARILPIVIHDKVTDDQIVTLASAIQEAAPRAIVIASMDMSHNLPEYIQAFHDEVTLQTIEAGTCLGICRLEVDANSVLATLLEVNRIRLTQEWHLMHHGSSLGMGATSDWRENTSHILGYFEDGEPNNDSFLALQFVGDVMLDRGVRHKIESEGSGYPWQEVERFFQGTHLSVANFEGTISEERSVVRTEPPFRFTSAPEFVKAMKSFVDVVSLANNHARDRGILGEQETQTWLDELDIEWFGGYATGEDVYRYDVCEALYCTFQISLIGYHQFGTSIEDLLPIIKQEKDGNRFVIIFPHWGQEYVVDPQEEQRELATQMVDAGADLIIGSHPHVVQGIELVNGVPVIYSMGNFVFDQDDPETDVGMSVSVLFSKSGGMIYLLPVETQLGQPVPLSDTDATKVFSNIANFSSGELVSYILTGAIPFFYD